MTEPASRRLPRADIGGSRARRRDPGFTSAPGVPRRWRGVQGLKTSRARISAERRWARDGAERHSAEGRPLPLGL